MIARLAAVIFYTPTFLPPAIFIAALGGWLGQVYMKSQLSVKREMSNAKSPVLSVFSGAVAGLGACSYSYSASCPLRCLTDVRVRSVNTGLWSAGSIQARDDAAHRPLHPCCSVVLEFEQVGQQSPLYCSADSHSKMDSYPYRCLICGILCFSRVLSRLWNCIAGPVHHRLRPSYGWWVFCFCCAQFVSML